MWRFSLRKGVEFHNGKTLEAEDVIASFHYHRGKDSTSSMKSLLENVTDIRTDGQQVVVFELQEGHVDFPFLTADVRLPILPAGAQVTTGVGTGGYLDLAQRFTRGAKNKKRC